MILVLSYLQFFMKNTQGFNFSGNDGVSKYVAELFC